MNERIAILGWGSLLWDGGEDFDNQHEPWQDDGPELPIEFSRVSASRGGALTLVIDPKYGEPTTVAYCVSRRTKTEDAIEDLRKREGATKRYIGFICKTGESRSRDQETLEAIKTWLKQKDLDAVIWTDLPSNFAEKTGKEFSVAAALDYFDALNLDPKSRAIEYIDRAPEFVETPLRKALADR